MTIQRAIILSLLLTAAFTSFIRSPYRDQEKAYNRTVIDENTLSNIKELHMHHVDLSLEIDLDQQFINGSSLLTFEVLKPTNKVMLDTYKLKIF